MPGEDPISILSSSTPGVDLSEVGGKGLSLGLLAQASLPVPDGFIITTTVYQKFQVLHRVDEKIRLAWEQTDFSRENALRDISQSLRSHVLSLPLPLDLAAQIEQAYASFFPENAAVAVRSSATVEDSPRASFAGQLESMLNVQGVDALLSAVRTCWASLWSERAAAIITDVGAPLSHAAIIARELGIPAVVGCTNATRRLKTGDRVRVDGGRGMVFLDYNAETTTQPGRPVGER